MDSKKIIEKLIKIAENQQKIINKLAQQATPEPRSPTSSAPAGAAPMAGGDPNKAMEDKIKATLGQLFGKHPGFKLVSCVVTGADSPRPDAKLEVAGADPGAVRRTVTETFLLDNKAATVNVTQAQV